MSTAATGPRSQSPDPLRRFMPVYACVAISASVAALGVQAVGHYKGVVEAALILIATPAIAGVIALGWSSAFALAGIVQQMFFSHRVRQRPINRGFAGAK